MVFFRLQNNLVLLKKELALLKPVPGFEDLSLDSQGTTSKYFESEATAIIKAAGEEINLSTADSSMGEKMDDGNVEMKDE